MYVRVPLTGRVELEDDVVGRLPAAELKVHDPVHADLPNVLQPLRADVLPQLHAEAGRHVRLFVREPVRFVDVGRPSRRPKGRRGSGVLERVDCATRGVCARACVCSWQQTG